MKHFYMQLSAWWGETYACRIAKFKGLALVLFLLCTAQTMQAQQVYTFTNCGASGRLGPTQSQVNAAYDAGNTLQNKITINTQGIQEWIVPASGKYRIEAVGAKGAGTGGGGGAILSSEFNLLAGDAIQVIVGQQGTKGVGLSGSINSGGGGGASFVINKTKNSILIISGGGGGGNGDYGPPYPNTQGNPANTSSEGSSTYQGGGGTNGSGGKSGITDGQASGGGGYLTNGENGVDSSTGGKSFINGAVGGNGNAGSYFGGDGGFGGGGGGASNVLVRGGGGGGYSGGQGGTYGMQAATIYTSTNDRGHGGGGGSLSNGTAQVFTSTRNMGEGKVIITSLYSVTLTENKSITCAGDATGELTATVSGGTGPYTYTWSAGNSSTSVNSNLTAGNYTVTVQDAAGNIITATKTLVANDTEKPTITAPAAVTISTDAGTNIASSVALGTPITSDNCQVTTITNDAPATFALGQTTVTWTVTDGAGNTATATQLVTVQDTEIPVPVIAALPVVTGECAVTVTAPTATDNVAGTVTATTNDPLEYKEQGTYTITWTYNDGNGNAASQTQQVEVKDLTQPVFAAINPITVNADAGKCGATIPFCAKAPLVLYAANGGASRDATDGGAIMTTDPVSGISTVIGTPVTGTGITGIDVTSDGIMYGFLQTGVLVKINPVTGALAETIGQVTVDGEAVSLADMAVQPKSNAIYGVTTGNTLLKVNAATAVATVIGQPVPNGSRLAIAFSSNGTLYGIQTNSASGLLTIDPVTGVVLSNAPLSNSIGVLGLGVHPVTGILYASECCSTTLGNALYTIDPQNGLTTKVGLFGDARSVQDLVFHEAACAYSSPTATDNCSTTIAMTGVRDDNQPLDALYPTGTTTITWTAADGHGNESTSQQTVTVLDTQRPTVITRNITVALDASGTATITAAQINNGSTDNCSIPDTGYNLDKTSFSCENVGPNTVTLTVTDVHGNSESKTAIVTVEDITAPVVLARNITVQLDATGNAAITAADVDAGSSDLCGAVTRSVDKAAFDCSNLGANVVTLTVTDASGNAATANATVTVEDKVAPVAIAKDITVQLDASGNATITAEQVNNDSKDNCGIASIALDKTAFTCVNIGANTVVLTVTDNSGNTAKSTAIVTIEDKVAPIALAKNLTVQLDALGHATLVAADLDNGSTDICGAVNLSVDKSSFDCSDLGANTVILTVTDNSGNAATATAIVTVEDNVAPTITAPAAVVVNVDAGKNTASGVALGQPVTADNCTVATVANNAPAEFVTGTTTITWTVRDASGNTATATQTVTVRPNVVAVALLSTIKVPIRTAYANVPLPATATVTYTNGETASVGVNWRQGSYNGLVAGPYELTGELLLAENTTNLDNISAAVTVEVQPNKVPTVLSFSATTFKPEAAAEDVIGTLTTTDEDDSEFVYELASGQGDTDNGLFEIRGDKVYLKSNRGLSGMTAFSIRVRSTDPYLNTIEKSFTLTKELYAKPEAQLKIVNAFSPDGDGINDTWTIPELRFYNHVEIEVYDRSGVRLFHTTNPEEGWNGQDTNGLVRQGAFLYIVQVKDINMVKKGVVTVLKK